eukprot:Gb_31355 [translate_table: standard]
MAGSVPSFRMLAPTTVLALSSLLIVGAFGASVPPLAPFFDLAAAAANARDPLDNFSVTPIFHMPVFIFSAIFFSFCLVCSFFLYLETFPSISFHYLVFKPLCTEQD